MLSRRQAKLDLGLGANGYYGDDDKVRFRFAVTSDQGNRDLSRAPRKVEYEIKRLDDFVAGACDEIIETALEGSDRGARRDITEEI